MPANSYLASTSMLAFGSPASSPACSSAYLKRSRGTKLPFRPLPYKMPNSKSVNHDLSTRLQALALTEHGIAHKIVTAVTETSRFFIVCLSKQARERGYNPKISQQ